MTSEIKPGCAIFEHCLEWDGQTPPSRSGSHLVSHVADLGADGKLVKGLKDVIPGAIPEHKGPLCLFGRLNFAEMQSRVSQLPLSTRLELCEIRHRAQQANNITEQAAYPD